MRLKRTHLRDFQIFFYGAGNLGKKLFRCFEDNGIAVDGFIDCRAHRLRKEMPNVFRLEDAELNRYVENSVVFLTGLFGRVQEEVIREDLAKRGFHDIFSLREIEWKSLEAQDFLKNLFIGNFDSVQLDGIHARNQIQEILRLFSTREEQEYIRTYIKAHRLGEYDIFPDPCPMEEQYLAKNIEESLNLQCFVDAGAYDGDVLRRFQENGLNVGTYIAFEPQGELCHRISDTVSSGISPERAMIFPCGLSNRWETIGFSVSSDGMSASKVDSEGDERIQCVPLDEVLSGVSPTLIKMDIEGMELKALQGAANTIRRYHPQLAICVYHELSHIWEIPLYIKSLYDGYRFHIHNYQYMGLETVVYAFS